MAQCEVWGHPDALPAIASDGQGSYRDAMVETGGQVPTPGESDRRHASKLNWIGATFTSDPASGDRSTRIPIRVIYGDQKWCGSGWASIRPISSALIGPPGRRTDGQCARPCPFRKPGRCLRLLVLGKIGSTTWLALSKYCALRSMMGNAGAASSAGDGCWFDQSYWDG